MTASAGVQRVLVQRVAQESGVAGAPRVRPHEDRGDGPMSGVESGETMPERGDTDGADIVMTRGPHDHVEAGGDGLEECGRVVLDAAVGRRRRRIGHLVKAAFDGAAPGIIERGPR
jgi:hypothetical protein